MERHWSRLAVPGCVPDLRRAVCAFADEEGVANPPLADIRLAVSEAVTNVVIHGYRSQSAPGEVEVTASVLEDRVEVVVSDHGMGFHPRDDSPGLGKGVELMEAVTDRFAIREARPHGTEIHMGFDCR